MTHIVDINELQARFRQDQPVWLVESRSGTNIFFRRLSFLEFVEAGMSNNTITARFEYADIVTGQTGTLTYSLWELTHAETGKGRPPDLRLFRSEEAAAIEFNKTTLGNH